MEQYSKFFQKSYLGDTDTDTQLNKFLEEHPNYVVDKISFENPKETCIENLFVVFKEKEPAADVIEMVHGEWEHVPYSFAGGYRCSRCGYRSLERHWKYCPNCGAKMNKKKKMEYRNYILKGKTE